MPLQASDPVVMNPKGNNHGPLSMRSAVQPALQQTPGGLHGSIGQTQYGDQAGSSAISAALARPPAGGVGNSANATAHQSNFGPVDTGLEAFNQHRDSAYAQAMRQMEPQMEAQRRQAEQSLVSRGLQPGSAAYNSELDRITRGQNDMLNQAAYGAQQQGMAAQNQYFNQAMQNNQFGLAQNNQNYQHGFGYDQLANQMGIANVNAAASRNNAGLSHALGMSRLNEDARQFDANNITQTQGMDQNFTLGLLDRYNNFMNTGINQFNAQQGANNQWYNQAGAMANNAPGVSFTPITDYTSNQIRANANNTSAVGSGQQMTANMIGGALSMFPSDRRLKKNIELVGRIDDINVYEFEYIDQKLGDGRYRGVMAQEVKESHPEAVGKFGGFFVVDYTRLPIDMTEVAA